MPPRAAHGIILSRFLMYGYLTWWRASHKDAANAQAFVRVQAKAHPDMEWVPGAAGHAGSMHDQGHARTLRGNAKLEHLPMEDEN